MRPIWRPLSVKGYLLAWIIVPITIFIVIDSVALYRNTLDSANAAYDRMLVTTAYSIGDSLHIDNKRLQIPVSYAALEVHEAEYSTRMIYRINELDSSFLAGDRDLPPYTAKPNAWPAAPALLEIYESQYGNASVRVAAVFQPLSLAGSHDGTIIQIAEPMENRTNVVRKILFGTLIRQAMLLVTVLLVTTIVVNRALRPLNSLKKLLDLRRDEDLSPLESATAPKELQPVISALNLLMARLQRLLGLQKRFVSDASHQLRTPLAVLKAQVQSGLCGDAPAEQVIREISVTVDRATNLANQLLSLAKVEQMRGKGEKEQCDLSTIAQDVAIDLSPLISEKNIDFSLDACPAWTLGHPWMIGEMIANLLNNAIRHTPQDGSLSINIHPNGTHVYLHVRDTGEGLSTDIETKVFEPFSGVHHSKGGGLGLTICSEIADSMGAVLTLKNRIQDGSVVGMDATVQFESSVRNAHREATDDSRALNNLT